MARAVAAVFLALAALFYLQFAIAAAFNSLTQAVLTLIGVVALATACYRVIKGQRAAPVVFIGTIPLFITQVAWSFFIDEPPIFALGRGSRQPLRHSSGSSGGTRLTRKGRPLSPEVRGTYPVNLQVGHLQVHRNCVSRFMPRRFETDLLMRTGHLDPSTFFPGLAGLQSCWCVTPVGRVPPLISSPSDVLRDLVSPCCRVTATAENPQVGSLISPAEALGGDVIDLKIRLRTTEAAALLLGKDAGTDGWPPAAVVHVRARWSPQLPT